MGGGGTTTQSQKSTTVDNQKQYGQNLPAIFAQDRAIQGVQQAKGIAETPYGWFPGQAGMPADYQSGVAPMDPYQQQFLSTIANYAGSSNPVMNNTMGQVADTTGGQYLNPESNPYLAQYVQKAQGDVTRNYMNSVVPQLGAAATRAGAFGGSSDTLLRGEAMRNLGDTLSNTATSMYAPAYEAERARQMQASSLAPATMQMPVSLATAGLGVGDAYQAQNQKGITDASTQWQQAQQWPNQQAALAAQLYNAYTAGTGWHEGEGNNTSTTNTTTTATKPQASVGSQIMGGLMTAGGLLAAPFTGGTSLLGSLGGLSSIFGGAGGGGAASGGGSSLYGTSSAYGAPAGYQMWNL